jgi:Kef-type K+ transport system membrane component KefB
VSRVRDLLMHPAAPSAFVALVMLAILTSVWTESMFARVATGGALALSSLVTGMRIVREENRRDRELLRAAAAAGEEHLTDGFII